MLNRSISQDRVVADLINDLGAEAGLVFTWLIAHLDREGRVHGDPDVIKGQVFPRIAGITPEVIRQTAGKAHELGLVIWYEVDGDLYLTYPAFESNQAGLRKNREPESDHPPPPEGSAGNLPAICRQSAGNLPSEGKGREGKGIEGKGKEAWSDSSAGTALVVSQTTLLGPEVARLPLVDGSEAVITTADVDGWTDAFPNVHVPNALKRMREWLIANPSKRKTPKGWRRFVVEWLGKDQDRGGGRGPPASSLTRKGEETRKALQAAIENPDMFAEVSRGKS